MSGFTGPNDKTNPGKVPKVGRVFWSKLRAYHGEEVTLSVRTENVADGTAAELQISPKSGGAVLDTVTGLSVKKGKIDHKYKIDWKAKAFPPGLRECVFRAVLGQLTSDPSPALYVDLEPPLFSV
jgi:hypothetical protein